MEEQLDIQTTADKIEIKISEIETLAERLEQAGLEKANTSVNYDKAIAVITLQLRNGIIKEFEGEQVGNLPATLIPTIAKGICFREAFDKEMGDTGYKSLITRIDAHKAVLNGYQSINKVMQ